jgi:Holliday junction resolvase RusA-like endonuclease
VVWLFMIEHHYSITPVPKPRQTQSDKWKKRPAVLRYRAFADECRLNKIQIPESGSTVTFRLPMPKSWSKKKRAEMSGKPHQQKPDADNLGKAIMDAVLKEDCEVWDIRFTKLWSINGSITVKIK